MTVGQGAHTRSSGIPGHLAGGRHRRVPPREDYIAGVYLSSAERRRAQYALQGHSKVGCRCLFAPCWSLRTVIVSWHCGWFRARPAQAPRPTQLTPSSAHTTPPPHRHTHTPRAANVEKRIAG